MARTANPNKIDVFPISAGVPEVLNEAIESYIWPNRLKRSDAVIEGLELFAKAHNLDMDAAAARVAAAKAAKAAKTEAAKNESKAVTPKA